MAKHGVLVPARGYPRYLATPCGVGMRGGGVTLEQFCKGGDLKHNPQMREMQMEPLVKINILTYNLRLSVNTAVVESIPLIWAVRVKFCL